MKGIIRVLISLITLSITLSCSSENKNNDFVIDSTRMGNIHLCDNISDVSKHFGSVKNLSFEGDEGVTWKGEKVSLSGKEWILVESSWADSSRIWRITTNSPKYVTLNGYRVGDSVSKIKQGLDKIDYYESTMGFELTSDKIKFGFSIEPRYLNDFYSEVEKCNSCPDFDKLINDSATITEIVISGDCSN